MTVYGVSTPKWRLCRALLVLLARVASSIFPDEGSPLSWFVFPLPITSKFSYVLVDLDPLSFRFGVLSSKSWFALCYK